MRAGGIQLTEQAERAAGRGERSADGCRQGPVAPEGFSAGPERLQPQLTRWASRSHGRFQGRLRRTDDRIWRENMGFSKRGERSVAPGRQGFQGKHFPGKQRKGIGGRHREEAIKALQLNDLRLQPISSWAVRFVLYCHIMTVIVL